MTSGPGRGPTVMVGFAGARELTTIQKPITRLVNNTNKILKRDVLNLTCLVGRSSDRK